MESVFTPWDRLDEVFGELKGGFLTVVGTETLPACIDVDETCRTADMGVFCIWLEFTLRLLLCGVGTGADTCSGSGV